MVIVRTKEQQVKAIAHVLDDALSLPGMRMRMGVDPFLGLIPVVGDALATVLGALILVMARQLDVSWRVIASMAFNQFKNGVLGAVPFIGDAYSFYFKSNAVNAALLLRTVKAGTEGACPLTVRRVTFGDVAGVALLIAPIVVSSVLFGVWFWNRHFSIVSLFFFSTR